jgi:hypothetical protein
MPDLSDEPMPLAIDNVPGVGTTQLGNAQRVHDTTGIYLRPYVGYSPAIASGDRPHGCTCGSGSVGKSWSVSLAATPLDVSSPSSRPVEPSKARGAGAGAHGDRLADRIVDHVRHLLGQHVSGVGNMNMLCTTYAGAQVGGV